MKPDLTKYLPAGMPYRNIISGYFTYLCCAILFSFGFLFRYANAYSHLFVMEQGERIIRAGTLMPEFYLLTGRSFSLFYILIPLLVLAAVFLYLSHYRESKSIYLMMRLPQKYELWIRCLTLPLLGLVIGILTGFMLLMLYYLIYMNVTPTQCIPPDQWQKLWSVIL